MNMMIHIMLRRIGYKSMLKIVLQNFNLGPSVAGVFNYF